jgi:hypothetical protein
MPPKDYKREKYTRHPGNLRIFAMAHPNGGKVIHRDVSVYDLYEAGGNKERKLKGYRTQIG